MSRRGVFPLSFTLDHVGAMTRTVADNALTPETIPGYDSVDPGGDVTRRTEPGISKKRSLK